MKYFIILQFVVVCAIDCSKGMLPADNNPVSSTTLSSANTLAKDIDEIARMIPIIPIRLLTIRYLINDEQFQDFVRIINSNDAYITQMRFRAQPEVMAFINWMVHNQIMPPGGELHLEESNIFVGIWNRTPFESNTVFCWQDIVNEFLLYYPEDKIRNHVQMKAAQNVIFAQLVQSLQALKPAYDRITSLPEAQRLAAALEAKGINISALDNFIRNQFGWQNYRSITASGSTTVPEDSGPTTAADVSLATVLPVSILP